MPTRLLHTINAPFFFKNANATKLWQNSTSIPDVSKNIPSTLKIYRVKQKLLIPSIGGLNSFNLSKMRFHIHTICYFTLLFPLANNFTLSYKAKRICVCFESLLVVVISWYDILNVYSICVIATIISYVFYSETNDTKICTAS